MASAVSSCLVLRDLVRYAGPSSVGSSCAGTLYWLRVRMEMGSGVGRWGVPRITCGSCIGGNLGATLGDWIGGVVGATLGAGLGGILGATFGYWIGGNVVATRGEWVGVFVVTSQGDVRILFC